MTPEKLGAIKLYRNAMRFTVQTEREEDGRWIAEVSELPGVMKYGQTRDEAIAQVEALALRVAGKAARRLTSNALSLWIPGRRVCLSRPLVRDWTSDAGRHCEAHGTEA